MIFIEGVDYWVRRRAFPCATVYAWAVSLGDGTFDIWLNTNVSEAKQLAGLRHELKHLEDNHFFRDDLTLAEKEAIAWGAPGKIFFPSRLPNVFKEASPGTIPIFASLDAFKNYMFDMRKQWQEENPPHKKTSSK